MMTRIFSAIVAAGLLIAFVAPVVGKLKDWALGMVLAAGIAMMLIDLWQSLRPPKKRKLS
ncbi:MAG: hypothetical protein HYU75_23475 [Betaproteobacteria bacterium]|nr:hypothetical protein [Betaproteobacteria bacterium]